MAPRPWDKRGSRTLQRFGIFELRQESLVSPRTGQQHDFVVIDSPDWVNVIALTDRDEVVMIRQYRVGRESVTLEIPGGVIDPGESPERAAARELMEETGYVAARWASLGAIDPNPAIQSNRCHTYLAEGCTRAGDPRQDEREDISVELHSLDEVARAFADGSITHALVSVAFHKLDLHRRGLLVTAVS